MNDIPIKKIVIAVIVLFIFSQSFDENGNRKRSSVVAPARPVDYQSQKQDEQIERSLCESGGGFFHGSGLGCEYDDYTILNGEIIEHD